MIGIITYLIGPRVTKDIPYWLLMIKTNLIKLWKFYVKKVKKLPFRKVPSQENTDKSPKELFSAIGFHLKKTIIITERTQNYGIVYKS